jgi:molybdopterin-synthase adenylyltransferase
VSVTDALVQLSSMAANKRLQIRDKNHSATQILSRLATGVPTLEAVEIVADVGQLSQEHARDFLNTLRAHGALVERHAGDDLGELTGMSLYDRQIRFLSFYETEEESGFALNRRLQQSSVLLAGIGGLGGWIALLLARMGVRSIVAVDFDEVELSNLHRQILYNRGDIGRQKVEAARTMLTAIDSDIDYKAVQLRIEHPTDLDSHLSGVDLVINPFPRIPSFASASDAVSRAALGAQKPCLHSLAPLCVGPLTLVGRSPCHQCALVELERQFSFDLGLLTAEPASTQGQTFLAALPPRQAITGGLMAWEAARFLSRMEEAATVHGVISLDINTYIQHRFVPVSRDAFCDTCGQFTASVNGDRGELATVVE